MNSAEFEALFCDVPRLTAEEVAAFLSEWTVVGVAAESREDAATAIPAAGFAEHSPAPGAHKLAPRAHRAEARDLGGDDGATEAAQEGAMSLKRGDRTFLHLLRRSR